MEGLARLARRIRPQSHSKLFSRQTASRHYAEQTTSRVPPRGPVMTQSTTQRPDLVGAGIEKPLQIEGKRRAEPHLLVFLGCLVATPPLIYYYWQYREQHMREKKEGMLREIQARAAARSG